MCTFCQQFCAHFQRLEWIAVTGTNSWNAKMVLGWNGPTPRIMMTHEDMYLIDLTELTIWENNDMMTIGTY